MHTARQNRFYWKLYLNVCVLWKGLHSFPLLFTLNTKYHFPPYPNMLKTRGTNFKRGKCMLFTSYCLCARALDFRCTSLSRGISSKLFTKTCSVHTCGYWLGWISSLGEFIDQLLQYFVMKDYLQFGDDQIKLLCWPAKIR